MAVKGRAWLLLYVRIACLALVACSGKEEEGETEEAMLPSAADVGAVHPCLEDIDIMRRVLDREAFNNWLKKFMPDLSKSDFYLAPGVVSERSDGKLVHLDGLNFSRAWCLYGLSEALPDYGHLRNLAHEHVNYSLAGMVDGAYEGEHWLASFALYALSIQSK